MEKHMFSPTQLIPGQHHRIYSSFLPFHRNLAPIMLIIFVPLIISLEYSSSPISSITLSPRAEAFLSCLGSDFPCQRLPLCMNTLLTPPRS